MLPESRPERAARGWRHTPPAWVDPAAIFFITINCQERGRPQLTRDDISGSLLGTISFYHDERRWYPEIFLLMPDHLHALVAFSWDKGHGVNRVACPNRTARRSVPACGFPGRRGSPQLRVGRWPITTLPETSFPLMKPDTPTLTP